MEIKFKELKAELIKEMKKLVQETLNYSSEGSALYHRFTMALEEELEKLHAALLSELPEDVKKATETKAKIIEVILKGNPVYLGDDTLKELAYKISHIDLKKYLEPGSPARQYIDQVRKYTYMKFASPYDEA